jgi:uncharacterized protein involved in response to NO
MVVFARGFRPFFLLAALQAAVFVPLWIAVFRGWLAVPTWNAPMLWHAHEMLFGFGAAAIAGFLLTSVPVWTGMAAVAGPRLALLAGLWVAGRAAMFVAGPAPLSAAIVDVAFLAALAAAIAPAIYRSGARRNYGFPLVLLALAAANALVHAQAAGLAPALANAGLRVGVDGIALLIVVIGGRIVPAFTTNALRRAGELIEARAPIWAERAAIPVYLLFAASDGFAPGSVWSGATACIAAVVLAARMSGWRSLRVVRDPLLGSLHLGHLWVVIGLAGVAGADLAGLWPRSIAVHALTAGAFGTMILAVMTRVSLGHTGRPLVAPKSAVAAYALVTIGALLRTFAVAAAPAASLSLLTLSSVFWSGAFVAFGLGFGAMLFAPRVDGRPG